VISATFIAVQGTRPAAAWKWWSLVETLTACLEEKRNTYRIRAWFFDKIFQFLDVFSGDE
jgi:hypothetical protein